MPRRKLIKLLGKDIEYTAIFSGIHGAKAVLTDLHHNNKYICDHVCVSIHNTLTTLKHGTKITFKATAFTYTDKKKVRKHGLNKCYRYYPAHECTSILKHDKDGKYKRCR